MTERELLELAALAGISAGMPLHFGPHGLQPEPHWQCGFDEWKPLTDDGDNRRLQVALKVGLVPIEDGGWACITWDHDDQVTLAAELDPNRAVVRAAAEIGKAMQQEHRRTKP